MREEDRVSEIRRMLDVRRFGVLATQSDGQPHVSLVAFTPVDGIRRLVFATYRQTRKYTSLRKDSRVALFIGRDEAGGELPRIPVLLTVHGTAFESSPPERQELLRLHRTRHPGLAVLLSSSDSALVCIHAKAYQIVTGIEDVTWYEVEAPG